MDSWRPEGWNSTNIARKAFPYQDKFSWLDEHKLIEAGADAMAEAKDKDIQARIQRIDHNAGDNGAFRLMIFAEFLPDEAKDE